MDLRLGAPSRARIIPRPGEGLRAAIGQAMDQAKVQAKVQAKAKDQAPRAEAAAARWWSARVRRGRGWRWSGVAWERWPRFLIVGLLMHAMFGANGMVVYRQKRAEMQALQSEVDRLQKENNQQAEQIRRSSPIRRRSRRKPASSFATLGREKFVLVSPDPPQKPPTGRVQNDRTTQGLTIQDWQVDRGWRASFQSFLAAQTLPPVIEFRSNHVWEPN
jgi:hypothetical protein